jgi:hypothetical protein
MRIYLDVRTMTSVIGCTEEKLEDAKGGNQKP